MFELSNVDRGTHTAAVRIVDRDGFVVIESDPTTFHLMRVTVSPKVPIAPANSAERAEWAAASAKRHPASAAALFSVRSRPDPG